MTEPLFLDGLFCYDWWCIEAIPSDLFVMLSLILPPILVVLALAVLSYLFFRRLPEVERREQSQTGDQSTSFLSLGDRLKRLGLAFVERFARSFNLLSLKIHNRLSALATSARAARMKAAERIAERKKARAEKAASDLPPFEPRLLDSYEGRSKESLRSSPNQDEAKVEVSPETESSQAESVGTESPSRLRRWFGPRTDTPPTATPYDIDTSVVRGKGRKEDEEAPLVSELLRPSDEAQVERDIRRRAAGVGRKFGSVMRSFRTETRSVDPSVTDGEKTPLIKKDQLEDILVERIALNPRDIEAYERLGDYYLEQGTLTDAKECYRQVLKLSPAYRLVKIKIRRLERLLEKERLP